MPVYPPSGIAMGQVNENRYKREIKSYITEDKWAIRRILVTVRRPNIYARKFKNSS